MGAYDDIINLPYVKSKERKHMSLSDRAAQFAPFAALTGYEDAVTETARITDKKIEHDEYEKSAINARLQYLADNPGTIATIICFKADEKKTGGAYVTVTGAVRKVSAVERRLITEDDEIIPIDDIYSVDIEKTEGMI